MSLQSEGSVAETSAGTPDTRQSTSDNGSAGGTESPFAGLQDAGTRQWLEKTGIKTVDDLAKKALNQESFIGSAVKVPASDAPPAEWDKFYSKAGRPEKPEAYELKRPDGLPEDLPYDEALAGGFRAWAHKAGLNGRQAQTLHDQFASYQAEQAKAHVTALSKAVENTAADLVKEWGPQQSETFKAKHEMANRALDKLGLTDEFKRTGIILRDGALTSAPLAKALALVGEKLFAEDKIDGVAARAAGVNPFKKGGSEFSVTGQTLLIKSDPARALQLAREAGIPSDEAERLVYGSNRRK